MRSCLLALSVAVALVGACAGNGVVTAGFWFEPISYASARLGGSLTRDEINAIDAVARAELVQAFRGLRILFADGGNVRYRVRVVNHLRDFRFKRDVGVAGQSRKVAGFRGDGAVSFDYLASAALTFAPQDADREALLTAIGRGIGRAAVHEFIHQLLPDTQIHDSRDPHTYEFAYANRRQQYFGPMRWDLARPLLQQRIGSP